MQHGASASPTTQTEGLVVEVKHVNEAVAEGVRDWFLGKVEKRRLDGDRSVVIKHPAKKRIRLKIKGAGFRGGPIRFGETHKSMLKAPVFDFDGRFMEDVASGHDTAFLGAATFQQVVTEYRVSAMLKALGFDVVPCIGYGSVTRNGQRAWFSLFECDPLWAGVTVPEFPLEFFIEGNRSAGELMLRLAEKHDLVGYLWYVAKPEGPYIIKDVHPFRQADPVNMSQLSWTMQLIFGLHIRALASLHFPTIARLENVPHDVQATPFRPAYPKASREDHEHMRRTIIAPYMLRAAEGFDSGMLLKALQANPISAAILERCPAKFSRYEAS